MVTGIICPQPAPAIAHRSLDASLAKGIRILSQVCAFFGKNAVAKCYGCLFTNGFRHPELTAIDLYLTLPMMASIAGSPPVAPHGRHRMCVAVRMAELGAM